MPKVVFLLISKLHGPPSFFAPLSAAQNRKLPLKRYADVTYSDDFAGFFTDFGTFIACQFIP